MQLNFDPEYPPEEPPENADPLLWAVAHALFWDHQPDSGNHCLVCQHKPWPCEKQRVAMMGLVASVYLGHPMKEVRELSKVKNVLLQTEPIGNYGMMHLRPEPGSGINL